MLGRLGVPPRLAIALAAMGAICPPLAPAASPNGPCGTPPCYSEFTVDGNPPPAGLSLNVMSQPSNGFIQMLLTTGAFNFELSPTLTNNSTVHVKLNLGTYDPVVFATTGNVVSYSE